MRAVALRLCRNRADADDLVQDTFERVLRFRGETPQESRLRPWLVRILHNRFIDQCRQSKREPVVQMVAERAAPVAEAVPAWAEIDSHALRQAVDQLDEPFRTAYRMHALEGKSYAEIAAALKVAKATVGTRLIRARRRLRTLLEAAACPGKQRRESSQPVLVDLDRGRE